MALALLKLLKVLKFGRECNGGTPINFIVRHWCEKIEGQPSRITERIGKDCDSAVIAWNMRYIDIRE